MPCIEWDDRYELGIERLDEHHQRLVGILNTIYESCLDYHQEGNLEMILEELIDYAGYHFAAEEQLMQNNGYPEQRIHTKEHDMFTRQIAHFQQDLFDGKGLLALEMVKFLGTWLIHHILDVDRKLCTYLAAKGISCPE
jgi:hemerythrin